jgi:Protein of unknown function (DUF1761)
MSNFKLNWVAILVAAIAAFIFEALWFSMFMKGWLAGIGRTMEWLVATGLNPAIQYATAILCSIIAATVLSICIQATGKQTARRGILCAVIIWFGFIATSWAKAYIFEVRGFEIYFISPATTSSNSCSSAPSSADGRKKLLQHCPEYDAAKGSCRGETTGCKAPPDSLSPSILPARPSGT